MNITEQIVELLKQGKAVEFPGIGCIASKQVAAHFDSDKSTFYPNQQQTQFSTTQHGSCDIVQIIAEKECVSTTIAEQMWRNYIDALKRKLDGVGSHEFPGLGTMKQDDHGYSFVSDTPAEVQPIEGVKTYNAVDDDPFAAFDAPTPVPPTQVVEQPAVVLKPEPEPVVEPEPVPVPEPVVEPEPEPVPEPQPVVAPEPEPEPEPEPMATPEPEPEPALPAASSALDDLKALENMQENAVPATQKKKKKCKVWPVILILLLLAILGGGAYWYFGMHKKSSTEQRQSNLDIEEIISGSEGADNNDEYVTSDEDFTSADTVDNFLDETETPDAADLTDADTPEASEADSEPETAEETDQTESAKATVSESDLFANASEFTFNTDLYEYSAEEIDANAARVSAFLSDYATAYAQSHHYTKAADLLRTRVEEYAGQRLTELLAPAGFAPQRFLCYEDYMGQYCKNNLKGRKASQKRVIVQTELMEDATLSQLLQEVVEANGVEQDAAAAPAKPKEKAPVYTASYSQGSKKGYDVIAGFFVSKASADRLATQLKRQGCDAYIIEIQHGYYVSMGSAGSRTKAEALYKHLSEWYKGDMSIKKF